MINWSPEVKESNYSGATNFLNLVYPFDIVPTLILKLNVQSLREFEAKDIFRASKLNLLPKDNFHVKVTTSFIDNEIQISPILLIKDKGKLVIADGYHRLCAIYHYNENSLIQCQIIEV